MSAAAILEGVGKRYRGIEAIREVTLALEPGETVALVGANGAGKTTLMKLILGLVLPSTGSVRLFGTNPASPARSPSPRPMNRFAEAIVSRACSSARALAEAPTVTSPDASYETTEGTSSAPSPSGRTSGFPSRTMAIKLFVVPRSIPTAVRAQRDGASPAPGSEI